MPHASTAMSWELARLETITIIKSGGSSNNEGPNAGSSLSAAAGSIFHPVRQNLFGYFVCRFQYAFFLMLVSLNASLSLELLAAMLRSRMPLSFEALHEASISCNPAVVDSRELLVNSVL